MPLFLEESPGVRLGTDGAAEEQEMEEESQEDKDAVQEWIHLLVTSNYAAGPPFKPFATRKSDLKNVIKQVFACQGSHEQVHRDRFSPAILCNSSTRFPHAGKWRRKISNRS